MACNQTFERRYAFIRKHADEGCFANLWSHVLAPFNNKEEQTPDTKVMIAIARKFRLAANICLLIFPH